MHALLLKNNEFEPDYIDENHHYIPRFILRNFKIKNEGNIYQYERDGEGPKKKSIIREAACIRNYYDVPHIKTKGPSLMFEKKYYSFLEYLAKVIIEDDILTNNELEINLTDQRGSFLASYIASQYTRTPAFRTQLKNFILFLFEKRSVTKKLFSNQEKDNFEKVFLENTYKVTRKELVEFGILNRENKRNVEKFGSSRKNYGSF